MGFINRGALLQGASMMKQTENLGVYFQTILL